MGFPADTFLGSLGNFHFCGQRKYSSKLNEGIMKADYSSFVLSDSLERIQEILDGADASYEDKDSIPSRDSLTFTNGFYVNCSALFVDMRGSKELSEKLTKPTLAKIYKAYISELVAVFRDERRISEISIEGDCVWGIFDTPDQDDIDSVFSIAATAASLVDVLNYKLEKKSMETVNVGIGMAYGPSLMIKAGYKGSGINDVTWMGTVVSEAAKLCSYGNRNWSDARIMVSDICYQNMNDHNKGLLKWSQSRECYEGNVINTGINDWLKEQK